MMNLAGNAREGRRLVARSQHEVAEETETSHPSCIPKLWTTLSSHNSLLVRKAIRWLQSTGKEHALYLHIPSRIGHSPCLDLALTANMEAHSVDIGDKSLSEEHCFHTSTLATGALYSLMRTGRAATSDEVMLTVALLFNFEAFVRAWSIERRRGPVDQSAAVHMKGLAAMFVSRPPGKDTSALYRALWYATSFYVAFTLQLFSPESSSPFEHPRWLDLDPPPDDTESQISCHIRSLKKTSNKLFICLPRLIKLCQRARRNPHDNETRNAAIKVATLLYGLKDGPAENYFLHSINVIKTPETESPGKEILPYIFKFLSFTQYEAALAYWTTRLFVLQQCHRLTSLLPTHNPFIPSDLEREGSRTAKNIMMSWASILQYKAVTKMQGSVALQAVWGVLGHFQVVKEGESLGDVRLWILRRSNELSEGSCVLTGEHLDGFAALQSGDGVWVPQMGALSPYR